jgi:hypothetical protein
MKFSTTLILGLALTFLYVPFSSAATLDSGLIKQNAYKTTHFSIEFSNLILDQDDEDNNGLPDIVDTIAEAAEYSRDVVINDLDYPDPMDGKNRKLIVVLDDRDEYLSPNAMGVTSILSNGDPFISIDPWMSESDLQITMGHEYFHTVQFGYDDGFAYVDQGANWAEETATWMEDEEYDDNNDYVSYISEYFDYVDYSVFASIVPSGSLFQYGLNIWPRFLSEYYDSGVIKNIWEAYFDSNTDYEDDLKLYDAVEEVLDSKGSNLRTAYINFSLWNLDLSQYEEGDSYPGVYTLEGETDDDYQEINNDFAPALFGTNYLYFDNASSESSFYFHVVKPEGVSFSVTLVPYVDGSVDLSKKKSVLMDQNQEMAEVLELPGLKNTDGVYAVVSPLDKEFSSDHVTNFDTAYLYYFFAQYGSANEDYSSVVSSSQDSNVDSTDVKEGTAGTDTVVVSDELTLNVVSYDEDSVSFSWNRLNDSTIDSYELRYGTESGDYSKEKAIDHAYTTAATVDGLKEGEKYYFELVALNQKGHSVGNPSAELSITPAQWIFTDVSYLDEHYDAIAALTEEGVFSGYSNGSFKPNDTINRAELLKIFVEGRGLDPDENQYKNCFPDVSQEWFAQYVCYAKAQGWVTGYSDGTYRPSNPVNKVEALKILFQVYEAGVQDGGVSTALSYSDLSQSAWYAQYVVKASELGILEETPGSTFSPSSSRTRGEMAEELYRYLVVEGLIKE